MKRIMRLPALALIPVLLAAAAMPMAASADPGGEARVEPAKLVVTVYYKIDASTKAPVAGAEVFALIDGSAKYACTNANGKAVFDNLGFSATVSILAVGPSVNEPRCSNELFTNPDSGLEMFAVFYKNHQGIRETDPIVLSSGRQSVKLVAKTPAAQRRLCRGFKVTHLGTKGNDNIIGSPDPDIVNARGGDDVVDVLGGDDVVCGGPGNDTLLGGDGNDFLFGEKGQDNLNGNADHDLLWGGGGTDTCVNGENTDSCELLL